jgi:flagellar basal-body rod modification protein FlgD
MSQISSATGVDRAVSGATSRFSEMSTEDFVRIIFTELTNQDPLQPNDTGALLDQLNSIRSIESDIALTGRLEALVTENKLAGASSMLGRVVSGKTEDLREASGLAVSVLRRGDSIGIELDDGSVIPVENVQAVIDLDAAQLAGGGGP